MGGGWWAVGLWVGVEEGVRTKSVEKVAECGRLCVMSWTPTLAVFARQAGRAAAAAVTAASVSATPQAATWAMTSSLGVVVGAEGHEGVDCGGQ